MNCWNCKWSREIPGSVHLRCVHPKVLEAIDMGHPLARLISLLGGSPVATKLKVKLNPVGVRNGWANHPFNFDPVWVEECEGFERKEEAHGE